MSTSASTDAGERRFRLGPLARLWPLMRPYKLRVAGAAFFMVIAAGSVLAFGSFLGWLIDNGFATGDAAGLDRTLVGLLGVIVVMAGATYGRAYLVAWIGERVACDLRRLVFENVVRLSPAFFEATRTGEVTSRLAGDTATLQTVVGSSASMALRNVILMIGGTTMMAITSPKLTALVLLVVPLVMGPILIFGRRVRGLSRQAQDRMGEAGAESEEALSGIRTIQAFNHEQRSAERYAGRIEASFDASTARTHARAALIATVMVLAFGAIGFVLWQGGHDVIAGRIKAGDLAAFVFYAVVVAAGVGAVSEFAADLARASGATERLFELLDAKPAIVAPASPVALPSPARGAVSIENLTFHYPSRPDRPALADLSLEVPAGQVVALVGPSGAGKTTLFQLLLRFHDPERGVIRFDGVDIRSVDPAALRARIAQVAQEPMIFADDVLANIRYGRPEASEDEVRRAAEAAQAVEFIEKLPQGWRTQLGERGIKLSGGQRQRIAIARALLRDPALLLLDEATSALDAESERLVQIGLARLMAGRTVIVIAHRLATVLRAARIHVLDQGVLVESGDHASLSAAGGLYARLARLQFAAERYAAE